MSKLIPNSFQHPNFYVDVLDAYLTPEESKVLTHAIRAILGWEENIESRQARIAYSTLLEGKTIRGEKVSRGVNLGTNALKNALDALHRYKILVKIGTNRHPQGQLFQLNVNETVIDWTGLKKRKALQEQQAKHRATKMRESQDHTLKRQEAQQTSEVPNTLLSDKRVENSCVPQKSSTEALVSDKRVTLVSDKRVTLLCDKRKETHIETHKKKEKEKEKEKAAHTLQNTSGNISQEENGNGEDRRSFESIYQEAFPDYYPRLNFVQRGQLQAPIDIMTAKSLPLHPEIWRRTCLWWAGNGYQAKSIARMLEKYKEFLVEEQAGNGRELKVPRDRLPVDDLGVDVLEDKEAQIASIQQYAEAHAWTPQQIADTLATRGLL